MNFEIETSNLEYSEGNYNWDELSVGNLNVNDSGQFFGKHFPILASAMR